MANHPSRGKNALRHPSPEEIRAAREAAGLTTADAAALVHTSAKNWEQWELADRGSPSFRPMHLAFWELFLQKLKTKAKASSADRALEREPSTPAKVSTGKLRTKFDRTWLPHRTCWRIARDGQRRAAEMYDAPLNSQKDGWSQPALIAMVFGFHAVEAFANFAGEYLAPDIWDDERNYFRQNDYRGWDGKLRKVLELVGLSWNPSESAAVALVQLRAMRDLIGHGRPDRSTGEVFHDEMYPTPLPPSKLDELMRRPEEIARLLGLVEDLCEDVHSRMAKQLPHGVMDAFEGSAFKGPEWFGGFHTGLNA